MRSMKLAITTIILISLVFIIPLRPQASAWPDSPNEGPYKIWNIKFSKAADRSTVNSDSIYITDSFGIKQDNTYTFSGDGKMIQVLPPENGYRAGETYILYVTKSVRTETGEPLKEQAVKRFMIKEESRYEVAAVSADGKLSPVASYSNFASAAARMSSGQAVVHNGEIIHMPKGLVSTLSSKTSSLTILYADKQLKKQLTYVSSDNELLYVNSDETAVEVELAGERFFIKQQNARLLPEQTLTNRSYYKAENGSLYHAVYQHNAKKFSTYEMGSAPAFLKEGERYYSTDGVNFYDKINRKTGTAYQYFQYLPLRSETKYSAAELDAYIMKRLKGLETAYPNSSTYKDAASTSKLIGLGAELKQIEKEKGINAMHILALAQHESQYGLSTYAQQYNNLFGLYVTDDNPQKRRFDSPGENIRELADKFLNKNYLPPGAAYANGTNFGNKAIGINVKYASDPYWGSKIAGHLYRMDGMMGSRELLDKAAVGLTNTVNLNARRTPNTSQPAVYNYPKTGMPLIILDNNLPGTPWIKIQSDSFPYEPLYVHGSYVDQLQ